MKSKIWPSNVLPLHLKQTFTLIWIFIESEGDGIKSRLPFKVFSTLEICTVLSLWQAKRTRLLMPSGSKSYSFEVVIPWFASSKHDSVTVINLDNSLWFLNSSVKACVLILHWSPSTFKSSIWLSTLSNFVNILVLNWSKLTSLLHIPLMIKTQYSKINRKIILFSFTQFRTKDLFSCRLNLFIYCLGLSYARFFHREESWAWWAKKSAVVSMYFKRPRHPYISIGLAFHQNRKKEKKEDTQTVFQSTAEFDILDTLKKGKKCYRYNWFYFIVSLSLIMECAAVMLILISSSLRCWHNLKVWKPKLSSWKIV